MSLEVPVSLKPLGQYIKRAEDLLAKDGGSSNPDAKVIAYYCRQFALEKAIPKARDPDVSPFVMALMDLQEAQKASLGVTRDEASRICENYAHGVFTRADDEDRAGNATKATAQGFYAAGTFFDILEQWDGPIDEEVLEKKKYAKWKAMDIAKALKEGRAPTPGGVDGSAPDFPSSSAFASSSSSSSSSAVAASASTSSSSSAAATIAASLGASSSSSAAPSSLPVQLPYTFPPPSAPILPNPQQASSSSSISSNQGGGGGGFGAYNASALGSAPASTAFALPPPMASVVPLTRIASSADPRVKDAIELTASAYTCLKHNEIEKAKARLTEALRRLG